MFSVLSDKVKQGNKARCNNMTLEKMLVKNKTNYLGFLKLLITKYSTGSDGCQHDLVKNVVSSSK